jgi:hypothetical protein
VYTLEAMYYSFDSLATINPVEISKGSVGGYEYVQQIYCFFHSQLDQKI